MHTFRKLAVVAMSITAIGGLGTTVATAASTPAAARAAVAAAPHLSAAVRAELKGASPRVVSWVEGLAAKGQTVLNVVQAPYKSTPTAGVVKPLATYPVGCSLFVALTRQGQYLTSNNLTDCGSIVAEVIEMYSGIGYNVGDFWDTLVTDERDVENYNFVTLDYVYNCTGDGTHIYQTVTNGYVEVNGTGAEASAYDYLPNASC